MLFRFLDFVQFPETAGKRYMYDRHTWARWLATGGDGGLRIFLLQGEGRTLDLRRGEWVGDGAQKAIKKELFWAKKDFEILKPFWTISFLKQNRPKGL